MYIKKILIAFFLALVLLSPGFAYAAGDKSDNFGADTAASKAGLNQKIMESDDIPSVIGSIINMALSFIGIIFFVLVLYAGFVWMTAMGNTESVTKAKNIIEAAVIGLVLVAGAYAIANFVFSRLGSGGGGTGGGGGSSVTTPVVDSTQCQNDKRYKPYSGYSCKPVDQCSADTIKKADTIVNKIAACKALPDPDGNNQISCNTALCGGDEIVCCN